MVETEEENYSDEVNEEDISNLINEANVAKSENIKLSQALNSLQGETKEGNFLHHQLDTQSMLDKLEHFYRGDVQVTTPEEGLVWQKQKNKALITFNEFGVISMMEVITKYIDKNTILSNYDEERIYQILGDVGDDLILFILCNYEKMGMDTHFKKTKFRLIITTTTHIIESTYRRSKHGKTLEEINQSRVVGQFGAPQHPFQGRSTKKGVWSRVFG